MTDEPIKRDQPMTRDDLSDRIDELFPPLAEVLEREWGKTPAGEPFVVVDQWAFTGLDSGRSS